MVSHGMYSEYASTDIIRHRYKSSNPDVEEDSYTEVLEFPSPPKGESKAVIHIYSIITGHTLLEFDSVKEALNFKFNRQSPQVLNGRRPVPYNMRERAKFLMDKQPWFFYPYVTIITTPAFKAPREVMDVWLGVTLQTRGRQVGEGSGVLMGKKRDGGYRVLGADALASLREHSSLTAHWWELNFFGFKETEFIFDAKVCREL